MSRQQSLHDGLPLRLDQVEDAVDRVESGLHRLDPRDREQGGHLAGRGVLHDAEPQEPVHAAD
eukprot:8133930-Alexandrium_andersonii.AAC.1